MPTMSEAVLEVSEGKKVDELAHEVDFSSLLHIGRWQLADQHRNIN